MSMQMDREEALELVAELQETVEGLKQTVEIQQNQLRTLRSLVAVGGFRELEGELEDHGFETIAEWLEATMATDETTELENRLDALESNVGILEETGSSKEMKVRDIVGQAVNLADADQPGAVLTARDIKGATGCTRRYAYDLIDDLPDEYHFLKDRKEVKQYGDLELDWDAQARGLFVDLEQLHTDPEAVNKFTTENSGNGGED